ncbi:MAG: 4Fe-4S dicluster domain-containing protein [Candidatus Njordarchaeales archaeon]
MAKHIFVDSVRCSGCKICEQVCAKTHFNVLNVSKSAIRIHTEFTQDKMRHTHNVCQQCGPSAPCIRACPENALFWDEEKNRLAIDLNKCVGHFNCVAACPYNAIYRHPALKHPIFCDLCDGDPQCVKWCPMGAIRLVG